MSYMYSGTILLVNLSEGKISKEPTSSYSGAFLGGRGINAKLLYDGVPPEVDPLDPANLLIFGTGPLCGTPVPASRVEVTTKSPETGFVGMANFGGYFGPELKFAGYDHIVITGKADKPVYLWINNDEIEIRDASELWGKDTYQTQKIISSEVGPEAQIACIGQAGENLVRFATIQHGLGNAAGRTGPGAVMGSKNLKAIVVRGTKGIALANPEKYLSLAEELQQKMRSHPAVQEKQQYGVSRIQYAYDSSWDPVTGQSYTIDPVTGRRGPVRQDAAFLKYKPRRTGCFGCPTQCMDLYPVKAEGGGIISCRLYQDPHTLGIPDDLSSADLVLQYTLSAQRYGVDTASLSVIIGWLMKLYGKGLITAKDTDGIPMEWGSWKAIGGMLEKIVHREGIGDVLADGMSAAAARIGRGYQDYAFRVSGLPVGEATRDTLAAQKGTALIVALSPRGDVMKGSADRSYKMTFDALSFLLGPQMAAEYLKTSREKLEEIAGTEKALVLKEYEGKPELMVYYEDAIIIADCMSACKLSGSFMVYPFEEECYAELFSIGTGVETSVDTLFQFAKRIRNLERAYSVREGLTRDTDSLPKGYMDNPVEQGEFKGEVLESSKFEEMKSKFYALRGWDIATGIPTREALEQTGLGDVAKDLEKRGKLPKTPLKGQSKTEKR